MVVGAAAAVFLLLFLPAFSNSTTVDLVSDRGGFLSVIISEKGLAFAKDLLIDQAVKSLTSLQLPNLHKSIKIPLIGGVDVTLSSFVITQINVSSSTIQTGDTGIVIEASGATANMSMHWRYSYATWLIPIEVSDEGNAHIEVEGMEIGLTMTMKNEEGSLKLTALECGFYMKDIVITLDGGASWFYQGLVDAFEDQIRSSVERAISKKVTEGIMKLDSFLRNVPKEIKVNDVLSLNVTFMDDPLLSNSSVEFDIDGLFTPTYEVVVPKYSQKSSQLSGSCGKPLKMLGFSLDEAVFNSASKLYFNAGLMHLTVDKVPDQSLLNTAGWKYIIPQLFKKYPDDDMILNISLTSAPYITITSKNVGTTIYSDMIIDVVDAGEVIPVACISVTVGTSGLLEISGNNLVGHADLNDFSLNLKWSKVGNFHMFLIQGVMRAFLNTILMPYINLHLKNGFPLPIVHGFTIKDTSILYSDSIVVVCSDVVYASSTYLKLLTI